MIIGALQKFSLLDYPGKVSAIIFTQGCNFRCHFCYNPTLVWPAYAEASAGKPASQSKIVAGKLVSTEATEVEGSKLKYASGESLRQQKVHPTISFAKVSSSVKTTADKKTLADRQDELFVFLKSRIGKLDAVVITGGEPCLQTGLFDFIKKIKALGYLVKLDTNGSQPETLNKLIKAKLIDYLAMDLKAPWQKYQTVVGVEVDLNKIKKSVKIIMQSGLPYEFRTTVVPGLLDQEDIKDMGKVIKGADKWYLQNFQSHNLLVNEDFMGKVPYNVRQMKQMAEIGRKYVKKCEVR